MRIPNFYSAGIRHDNLLNKIKRGALIGVKDDIEMMGEGINTVFNAARKREGRKKGTLVVRVAQEFPHNAGLPWEYRVYVPFAFENHVEQAKMEGTFQHGVVRYLCEKSPALHGTLHNCPPKEGVENYNNLFKEWARDSQREDTFERGERGEDASNYSNVLKMMDNFMGTQVANQNGGLLIANAWQWCPDREDCVGRLQINTDNNIDSDEP